MQGIQPYPYKTEPEKFDPYFGFVHHQMASPPSRSAWDSLVTHLRSQAEKLSGPPHQAVPLGIQILEVAVRMMAATFCSVLPSQRERERERFTSSPTFLCGNTPATLG